MSDDASGYLPPHELRGLLATLVDRNDHAHSPGPTLATTSSPGVSPAVMSPAGFAPTLPADDPQALALAIQRIASEQFGEASPIAVVPLPTPDDVLTARNFGSPVSPGISPQVAPFVPAGAVPSDAVTPQVMAASPPTAVPSKDVAGVPTQTTDSPVPRGPSPIDALHAGSELRVPFVPFGPDAAVTTVPATPWTMPSTMPSTVPSSELWSQSAPPVGGIGAMSTPPQAPSFPASFALPMFDERLPLVDVIDEPVTSPVEPPTRFEAEPRSARDQTIRQGGGTAFAPYLVRRDFPILEERVHGGKRIVWLDNAATTQKPRAVIDRLTYYYEHENSNVHRAAHVLAARATDAYESARETTRKFLNAGSTSEIIFVRGATEGINLIAKSWGWRNIEEGDEILLTHLEHHANIVPWQQLAELKGAKLRVAPVDDRGDILLDKFEKLMCSRTKLVAFTQVSNALGTITPAREMIEIAKRWGATTVLDGAQAVSHMPVDVQDLGCDFYVFSGHKVFAPTGIGAVYGRRDLLDAMPPWQGGGNMIQDVTFERTLYQQPPWRFEAGTGNIADAAGLGSALDYVMRIGMATIDRYEHELLVYATEQLHTVPGLRIIGTAPNKAGVLSFVLAGQRTEDVGAALDKEGIAVRSGHHCAQPILRRFGLESSVRASLAFYNVREDIDALVSALKRLQASV